MTDKQNLINNILKLKKQKDAVILAHNYQIPAIQDLADFLGDSLELSRKSKEVKSNLIVFCGVRFMAETAKILSPHKKVLLPVLEAGCPLADTITVSDVNMLRKAHPDAWVVSYVNTSAEIKAVSDVCCTSANAVKVVKDIPVKKVIFVPDKNLGWWVKKNVPNKEIIVWSGFCYVHEQFTLNDLELAKKAYPEAEVLVHPECRSEILVKSDYVLSTSGMLKRVKESTAQEFIIGTEEGIIHQLQKTHLDKKFYSLGNARTCVNMKKTTLEELYKALDKEVNVIELSSDVINKAKNALERMVNYV